MSKREIFQSPEKLTRFLRTMFVLGVILYLITLLTLGKIIFLVYSNTLSAEEIHRMIPRLPFIPILIFMHYKAIYTAKRVLLFVDINSHSVICTLFSGERVEINSEQFVSLKVKRSIIGAIPDIGLETLKILKVDNHVLVIKEDWLPLFQNIGKTLLKA